MSLMSLVGNSVGKFLSASTLSQISIRDASKKAGGSTRNRCRNTHGKRRGIKVYDGQRVPAGTVLVSQYRLQMMPGWNACLGAGLSNIVSTCNGRVIITTERVIPKKEEFDKLLPLRNADMPDHLLQEKIFRAHVHVIPDEQHQYFKLVEQI